MVSGWQNVSGVKKTKGFPSSAVTIYTIGKPSTETLHQTEQ